MKSHLLPPLPYAYDSLEPFVDAETMHVHHDKHHQTYVDKLNAALEGHDAELKKTLEELLTNLDIISADIRTAVKNHGGGHFNHTFFWPLLKKDAAISGDIRTLIDRDFGTFDAFKTEFAKAATNQFGSGWSWLVIANNKLEIMQTANQDTPISVGKKPLLTIDVWEHAYYLKYRNRRAEYIEAFFNVINWDAVNKNLANAS